MMEESRPAILFVEDISDTRELVEFSLQQDGFDIKTVQTAQEGLDLARRKSYALILLDIGLPDKDGLQLCREIREFDPKTPIVLYTAYGELLDEQEAARAGAQGCLRKPDDTARLSEALRGYIGKA
jgi:CheY-like chemotaxis protein